MIHPGSYRMASWILRFALAFLAILNNSRGNLITTPQPQKVTEGGSVWFNCSTDSSYGGIDWKHSYVGSVRPRDVYVNGMLMNGYKDSGRFSVITSTIESSVLLIQDVQMHDAGEFICVDNNGTGESSSAKLTVQEREDFRVVPQDTIVSAGQTVRLTCSTVEPKNVWWKRSRVGTTAENDVYMGVLGFVNEIAKSGRYSIDQDNATRRYDLLIRNVEPADAGKFFCVSNGGMGKLRSAELTVIDTYPACSSDIPIDGVVGENSCGITPDEVVMFCNVNFTGNNPPELTWVHAQDDSPVKEGHIFQTNNPTSVRLELRLRNPTSHADWTGIRCKIGNLRVDGHSCSPVSSPMKFVNLSQSSQILTSKPATVSCLQNATDSCLYRWMKVQDGVLSTVTDSYILNLLDVGDFMCEANCTIRGQLCIMHPMSIEFRLGGRHENHKSSHGIFTGVIVLLLVLVIALCLLMFMKWKGITQGSILRRDKNEAVTPALHRLPNVIRGAKMNGFTKVRDQIYTIFEDTNYVSVYDGLSFQFIRKIAIPGMTNPRDIVGSDGLNYIYVLDSDSFCIWRVPISDQNDAPDKFAVNLSRFASKRLSLTPNGKVVITTNDGSDDTPHKVVIYDKAGLPGYSINLHNVNEPVSHAIAIGEDKWIVSVGGRLGLMDKLGNILNNRYYPGQDSPTLPADKCGYISIDDNDFVYLVNCESCKIIVLDKELSAVDTIDLNIIRYKTELLQKCVVFGNQLIIGFTSGRILMRSLPQSLQVNEIEASLEQLHNPDNAVVRFEDGLRDLHSSNAHISAPIAKNDPEAQQNAEPETTRLLHTVS